MGGNNLVDTLIQNRITLRNRSKIKYFLEFSNQGALVNAFEKGDLSTVDSYFSTRSRYFVIDQPSGAPLY